MAQSLEVNIKTTSDVPQAMDKAKSATVSFGKQVEDIQKKFSTAFKDIFLGFTAPMVLLQSAIHFITGAIEKAKQDAKDGLELIAKGETIYASSEEKKMAAFFKAKQEREDEMKKVEAGKAEITRKFLETEPGKALVQEYMSSRGAAAPLYRGMGEKTGLAQNAFFQQKALEAFLASPEGKAFAPIFANDKTSGVKSEPPLGSGVIGVGASPQIALAIEANDKLESIDNKLGLLVNEGIERDPTKPLGRKNPLSFPGLQR